MWDAESGILVIIIVTASVPAAMLAIAVHEAGHCVVGRLAGLRIKTVEIGNGREIVRLSLGLAVLRVRLLPIFGSVSVYRDFTWSRRATIALSAGGGLANLICGVAFSAVLPDPDDNLRAFSAVAPFALNQFLGLLNLVIVHRSKRGVSSDGLCIRDAFRRRSAQDRSIADLYDSRIGRRYHSTPHAAPSQVGAVVLHAIQWGGPAEPYGAKVEPDPVVVQAERDHLRWALLGRSDLSVPERAILLDCLLSEALLCEAWNCLPQLDRLSGELIALVPDEPTARGTRGAVLVLLGNPEGRRLIERDQAGDEPFDDLMRRVFLARAALDAGERAEAAALVVEVRARHGALLSQETFPILHRIETELAQGSSPLMAK